MTSSGAGVPVHSSRTVPPARVGGQVLRTRWLRPPRSPLECRERRVVEQVHHHDIRSERRRRSEWQTESVPTGVAFTTRSTSRASSVRCPRPSPGGRPPRRSPRGTPLEPDARDTVRWSRPARPRASAHARAAPPAPYISADLPAESNPASRLRKRSNPPNVRVVPLELAASDDDGVHRLEELRILGEMVDQLGDSVLWGIVTLAPENPRETRP